MSEESIINIILNNFNFGLIITINSAIYFIIKAIEVLSKSPLKKGLKILITLFVCIILGIIYYNKNNSQEIISTCISAPLLWDWIIKPIVKKFNMDYNE